MTRRLTLILGLAIGLAAGCKSGGDAPLLGGETNWFKWCGSDQECVEGNCVCGVCSSTCGEPSGSCADGPPNSACFAAGSIGYAAVCQSGEASGICLGTCSSSSDCRDGFRCVIGACLLGTLPGDASTENASSTDAGASLATGSADPTRPSLLEIPLAEDLPSSGEETELESLCPPVVDRCPTLEEVLGGYECGQVITRCGLVQIHVGEVSYWYEGFGSAPVAVWFGNVPGGMRWGTTRSLECDRIDAMCSTCGDTGPRCEDVPNALPEPPAPPAVPGCACEPDGLGAARLSLDCFCSVYECPSYDASLAECRDGGYTGSRATFGCARVRFGPTEFGGRRFAYDPSTGALVAAEAFSPGPLTAPCNTYRVRAGEPNECGAEEPCLCNQPVEAGPVLPLSSAQACDGEAWFLELSSNASSSVP